MTSIIKKVYIDKLVDIVDTCSNRYQRTNKMKPSDVDSSTCIYFSVENNQRDLKIKVDDPMRTSKNKNIFSSGCTPSWAKEVLVIKKTKNFVLWAYVPENWNVEEIVRAFTKKSLLGKKQSKQSLKLKK